VSTIGVHKIAVHVLPLRSRPRLNPPPQSAGSPASRSYPTHARGRTLPRNPPAAPHPVAALLPSSAQPRIPQPRSANAHLPSSRRAAQHAIPHPQHSIAVPRSFLVPSLRSCHVGGWSTVSMTSPDFPATGAWICNPCRGVVGDKLGRAPLPHLPHRGSRSPCLCLLWDVCAAIALVRPPPHAQTTVPPLTPPSPLGSSLQIRSHRVLALPASLAASLPRRLKQL
jgi:hypothetical protein